MRAPFAPAHPTPPSQPAQTITGPGPDGFKLIEEDADHLEHHRAENAGVQLRGCSASCRSLLDHQDRHDRGRLAAEMVHLDVAAARRNLRRRRSLGGTRSPTASPRHACEQPSWAKFRKRTDATTSVPKADLGPQRVRQRTVLPRHQGSYIYIYYLRAVEDCEFV